MSIETDARQEAERRWPTRSPHPGELTYPRSALMHYEQGAFIAGVAWAREQDTREPSEDTCPEWQCPDLSSEDRREGKTCPDHPCTCTREPSDAQLGVMAQAFYEELSTSSDITFQRMTAKPEIVRGLRAALLAAREVRNRG